MTDIQLRCIVLKNLYENRGDYDFELKAEQCTPPLLYLDLVRICDQLKQHGLVEANILHFVSGQRFMAMCRISARGVDVVESGISPDLRIDLMNHQTVNITDSSNVIVGNNNQQSVIHSVQELAKVIDSSSATPEQKSEAKGLLKQFLAHPLLAAIVGGAVALQ